MRLGRAIAYKNVMAFSFIIGDSKYFEIAY